LPRLEIQLLGPPQIVIDGRPSRAPRGRKAWALLAFLLLSRSTVTRERLAALLFADADDPLGAVRWNLAELRRALTGEASLGGDPISLGLPGDAVVDVHVLSSATWMEAVRVRGLGRELLEGIDVSANAAFETWLLAERRHVTGLSAAVLREAATARLAAGSAREAIDLATKLVAFDEFDEEAHALLARAYVASGAIPEARQHVAAAANRLRRELGTEPTATLLNAVDTALIAPLPGPHWDRTSGSVESLITAGEAAVSAGVLEPGFEILRRAVADAHDVGDRLLEARALVALGTAFIHGARGRDGEGAKALHAAVALGHDIGAPAISSEASRELGYVELKQARYERAAAWLDRAISLAPDRGTAAAAMRDPGSGSYGPGKHRAWNRPADHGGE
jgi:DNA-binding SARP family transcriptional activator